MHVFQISRKKRLVSVSGSVGKSLVLYMILLSKRYLCNLPQTLPLLWYFHIKLPVMVLIVHL